MEKHFVIVVCFLLLQYGMKICNAEPANDTIERFAGLTGKRMCGMTYEEIKRTKGLHLCARKSCGYSVNLPCCQCDELCTHFNDCCFDFWQTCASNSTHRPPGPIDKRKVAAQFLSEFSLFSPNARNNSEYSTDTFQKIRSFLKCATLPVGAIEHWSGSIEPFPFYEYDIFSSSFYQVSTCPNGTSERLEELCRANSTIETLTPVEAGKIMFANQYCAACHGVYNFEYWLPFVFCPSVNNEPTRQKLLEATSLIHIEHLVKLRKCRFNFIPTSFDSLRVCPQVTQQTCNVTGKGASFDPLTEDLCSSYVFPVEVGGQVYRNAHCAVCNVPPNGLECQVPENDDDCRIRPQSTYLSYMEGTLKNMTVFVLNFEKIGRTNDHRKVVSHVMNYPYSTTMSLVSSTPALFKRENIWSAMTHAHKPLPSPCTSIGKILSGEMKKNELIVDPSIYTQYCTSSVVPFCKDGNVFAELTMQLMVLFNMYILNDELEDHLRRMDALMNETVFTVEHMGVTFSSHHRRDRMNKDVDDRVCLATESATCSEGDIKTDTRCACFDCRYASFCTPAQLNLRRSYVFGDTPNVYHFCSKNTSSVLSKSRVANVLASGQVSCAARYYYVTIIIQVVVFVYHLRI